MRVPSSSCFCALKATRMSTQYIESTTLSKWTSDLKHSGSNEKERGIVMQLYNAKDATKTSHASFTVLFGLIVKRLIDSSWLTNKALVVLERMKVLPVYTTAATLAFTVSRVSSMSFLSVTRAYSISCLPKLFLFDFDFVLHYDFLDSIKFYWLSFLFDDSSSNKNFLSKLISVFALLLGTIVLEVKILFLLLIFVSSSLLSEKLSIYFYLNDSKYITN